MILQTIADLQDPQHHVQPRVKATRSERKKVLKRAGWGLALIGMLLACLLWGFFSGSGDSPGDPRANEGHRSGVPGMRESDEHGEHRLRESRHHDKHEGGRDANSHEAR